MYECMDDDGCMWLALSLNNMVKTLPPCFLACLLVVLVDVDIVGLFIINQNKKNITNKQINK